MSIRKLNYFINLDERGEFYADIRTVEGNTIFEIDSEYSQFLSEEGVNLRNVTSIREYLRAIGELGLSDILCKAN